MVSRSSVKGFEARWSPASWQWCSAERGLVAMARSRGSAVARRHGMASWSLWRRADDEAVWWCPGASSAFARSRGKASAVVRWTRRSRGDATSRRLLAGTASEVAARAREEEEEERRRLGRSSREQRLLRVL